MHSDVNDAHDVLDVLDVLDCGACDIHFVIRNCDMGEVVLSGTIVVLEDCDVLNVLFLFGFSADSHRLSFSVQFLRIQNSIPD